MNLSRLRALLPALVVVVADQGTKAWAVNRLSGGRTIDLVGSLRFALGFNSGMAFSRGTGFGPYIGVLATAAVVAMVWSLRSHGSRLSGFGMALVIGGATGNLLDRFFRGGTFLHGSVVDFIDLQWFPAFNVADSGITVGGGLVVLSLVLSERNSRKVVDA